MNNGLMVVDCGNTCIAAGVYEGQRLVASWSLTTVQQTQDELTLKLAGLLRRDGIDPANIRAAVLASVVPPMTETLRGGLRSLLEVDPLVVRPGIKTGMPLLYDHPEEIGADRIVNSLAAHERVGGAAIVVDFGTATTFDCVSAAGEYLGGVIAPGLGISAEALFRSAARLPRVEIARPARVIGKTTVSAIQSGLFYGYVGLIDGLLRRLLDEMGVDARVLATGGLSELMAEASEHVEEAVPQLTLDGLRIIHERNA